MDQKTQKTQKKQMLALAQSKSLLQARDLEPMGIPRIGLTRLVKSGQLVRVGRGVYRLPGGNLSENEGLAEIATRAPQAVICLLTALQFHELTTQLPKEIWIAMPRGSHLPMIDYPPIKMVAVSEEFYSLGVETHMIDGVPVRIYGKAKTVVDCFRFRSKLGIDVAIEALKDACEKSVSADEIWRFAKICRVAGVMQPYLEAMG